MAARIDREELRQLIREALREALGETASVSGDGRRAPSAGARDAQAQQATPPAKLPTAPGGPDRARQGQYRMESGVLTEAKVAELAKQHAKLVCGAPVVITPLARDKAREVKLEIVRQK